MPAGLAQRSVYWTVNHTLVGVEAVSIAIAAQSISPSTPAAHTVPPAPAPAHQHGQGQADEHQGGGGDRQGARAVGDVGDSPEWLARAIEPPGPDADHPDERHASRRACPSVRSLVVRGVDAASDRLPG